MCGCMCADGSIAQGHFTPLKPSLVDPEGFPMKPVDLQGSVWKQHRFPPYFQPRWGAITVFFRTAKLGDKLQMIQ